MGKVTQLRVRRRTVSQVFVAVSDSGNGEEIYLVPGPNGEMIPLVAVNARAVGVLRRFAQSEADQSGKTVSIYSFTRRSLYDTVRPSATGD